MSQSNALNRMKTVLITGASSGIGYELAQLFARDGYDLVLVARGQQKLDQIAAELQGKFSISVKVISKDLSLPASPEGIFTLLQRESIQVDVLVNNAGFANYGLFSETDQAVELNMMQLNMMSLTHLTKLFLNEMLKSGGENIEHRLNSGFSTRSADGGLLCDQSLCAFVFQGNRQ